MKTPKFLNKLSAVLTPRPKKRLQATARAARPAMDDYDDEEPTTKLSSAFIVVLILHVVAVGGIYAFNSIKASRRDREVALAPAAPAVVAPAVKPAAQSVKSAAAPAPAAARNSESAAPTPTSSSNKAATGKQYEVKAGDNLTKIAFAYGISPAELAETNHLKESAVLKPGQMLVIPSGKTATKPATPEARKSADIPPTKTTPGLYTVKKGDTLTSIARDFGLTTLELSKANKITDPKKLQLGQVLKVPPRKS